MRPTNKPIAFVDETGFIIPNPNYSQETLKHVKGRFIYTEEELDSAIKEMNRLQNSRRELADKHYGADAIHVPREFDDIEDVIQQMDGTRETVPSMKASQKRGKKTEGKSNKLKAPNVSDAPLSLHKEREGINLTEEELDDYRGIDSSDAVAALFGGGN